MGEYRRTVLNDNYILNIFEISKKDFSENIKSYLAKIDNYLKEQDLNGTWMLCAKNKKKEDYVVLQVASSKDIRKEIRLDLNLMLPGTKEDVKSWSSHFYEDLLEIDYSKTPQCQKYNDMYEKYQYFAVVIINYEKVFSNLVKNNKSLQNTYENLKKECAEVYLACKYKAVYWNPNHFNGECGILSEFEDKWVE